jgi:hypothetical protein
MKPLFRSKGFYNSRIIATNPLVYFPLDETSGSVSKNWGSLGTPANGQYTGVDLHNTPGPKGGGCPYFDGVHDWVNIYTAALAAAFNGDEGSLAIWSKVYDVSIWSDGSYHYQFILMVDIQNRVNISKSSANKLNFSYYAGNVTKAVNLATTTIDWFCAVLTYSKSNDRMRGYFNGVQVETIQTGLGVWVGSLNATSTAIGTNGSGLTYPWPGWLAHAAYWDRELSLAEIQALL